MDEVIINIVETSDEVIINITDSPVVAIVLPPTLFSATVFSDTQINFTWVNNINGDAVIIERSLNGNDFFELYRTIAGVATYPDTGLTAGTRYYYRARSFDGINYSAYTNVEDAQCGSWDLFKSDTNVVSMYDPLVVNGARRDVNGVEDIYWDLKVPYMNLIAEQSSGVIILYAVYKITATQANFFYTGCAIGDVFACGVVKTCDANNKVRRVSGNHLTQPVAAKRFVNGVGDGISQFMKTAPFNFVQPEFVYWVGKQITWTSNDRLWDGNIHLGGACCQYGVTPKLLLNAFGTTMIANGDLPLNQLGIIRACYNNVNSKLIIDNNKPTIDGTVGTYDMGGFTIGATGVATSGWANIYFAGAILRNEIADENKEVLTYNVLNSHFAIGKPDTRNTFDRPKLVITFDDGTIDQYTTAFPCLQAKGVKATFYNVSDFMTTGHATYMNWTEAKEMQDAGMDIQCHTKDHANMTTLDQEQTMANLQAVNDAFIAAGMAVPRHLAYPGGAYDAATVARVLNTGLRDTARLAADIGGYKVFRKQSKLEIPVVVRVDNIDDAGLVVLKIKIDNAIYWKSAIGTYGHGMSAGGGIYTISQVHMEEIIDYRSDEIDKITMSELYALMEH